MVGGVIEDAMAEYATQMQQLPVMDILIRTDSKSKHSLDTVYDSETNQLLKLQTGTLRFADADAIFRGLAISIPTEDDGVCS